jgi:GH25 family lysozyme M1 (1,4-beta-N-acetylmuramidase)
METQLADWSMYQSLFTGNPNIFADKYNPNKWVVDLNFSLIAQSGIAGVILRVGISQMKDPCFDRYLAGVQQIGLPWGIYHAYDPGRSAVAQADLVRSLCPADPPLGVFGDVEMGDANFAGADAYLRALDERFGRTAGLYSANWYMAPRFTLGEQSQWRGRTAWFAGYPNLVVPDGWIGQPREFDVHQFTDSGTLAGMPRATDLNRLHPSLTINDLLNGVPVLSPPARTRPARAPRSSPAAPAGAANARFGLHGRADGRMQPADFQVVQSARVEAVKLMSTADPNDVDRLRAIDSRMLIVVRGFVDFRNRVITAQDFAQTMAGDLAPFYAKGIRHFEVHNEPNLADEGLIVPGRVGSWADGAQFGAWFTAVVAQLTQIFPDAVWGWPGLSPGESIPGVRADAAQFLSQAGGAPGNADWIGLHCYWQNDAELELALDSVMTAAAAFPGQRLYITEYANVAHGVDPAVRASQYVRFCAALNRLPVVAAFAFVVSASNQDFAHETWRDENGQLSAIPGIVGARTAPAARWWEAWPEGIINPPRRLASPPAPIQIFRKGGQPLSPPVFRQNAMDVFERNGDLLRVLQEAINGKLWWVQAADVQPE